MEELKEALKDKKAIIGTDRTLKNLKMNKVKKVYISSNCDENVKDDLKHYCKLYSIPLIELKENNEELGIVCKKPFAISVLSI
jgi:large subunit ribosomal protein L30e